MNKAKNGIAVAITGSSGYLASVLLPLLEKDKNIKKIFGIDVIPPKGKYLKLEHYNVDIMNHSALVDIFKQADCVLHMVFNINGSHDGTKLERLNIQGSKNVIDAAIESGVKKFIFTSSLAAYGSHKDNPIPIKETDPLRGIGTFFYSEHKHIIENYLDEVQDKRPDMKIIRLRFCTITGPMSYNETVTFYTSPIIVVFPFNQPPVQLLHEDDAAKAFYLAIVKNVSGSFNIGSDWEMTVKEHAKYLNKIIMYLPVFISKHILYLLWWLRLIKFHPSWIKASIYPIVGETLKAEKELGWKAAKCTKKILLSIVPNKKKDKFLKANK